VGYRRAAKHVAKKHHSFWWFFRTRNWEIYEERLDPLNQDETAQMGSYNEPSS